MNQLMLDAAPAAAAPAREPAQAAFGDDANPLGLDGIEFVEYATARPQALGQVLETMGFRPVARHRSREVLLYRQGGLNIVVNAHPVADADAGFGPVRSGDVPAISAVALRVRDARAAHQRLLERGGWEAPSQPDAMELNIPAIHGPGGSRLHVVDRYREFSIWDVDFVPIPSVDLRPPPLVDGLHWFGLVQYIGRGRRDDWIAFYRELFGAATIPDHERYGILPAGTLLRAPALEAGQGFLLQLVEPAPEGDDEPGRERLQRIGLGVPDVPAAVQALRARGVEFVDRQDAHPGPHGALTRTYLGSVAFELVHAR